MTFGAFYMYRPCYLQLWIDILVIIHSLDQMELDLLDLLKTILQESLFVFRNINVDEMGTWNFQQLLTS